LINTASLIHSGESDVNDDDDTENVLSELFRGERRPDTVDDEDTSLAVGAGVGAIIGVGGLGVRLDVSLGVGVGAGLVTALPLSSSLDS